ncbi:S9 family peptidase [Nocardioides donggukensis]|uniref:S9 family peptidase n=1 Tax=Nocardioides donggukensis TaxID=2774019 RepID=A0A927K207_9ACTN|nr:prolyl oligopeptidase family serine peptidase [Nocardioides donggukensis]MBD8868962.1 S9 family peptidase [Nocardioides donggukensis]
MTRTEPYGTWDSPIDAVALAAGSGQYEQVLSTGDALLFTRSEPGSAALRLHRWTPESGSTALAPGLNVRSRVHEYGGGAVAARGDVVVVVDFADQRLHRVHPDGGTTPLTPETGARVRFADGLVTDHGLVVVRETHDEGGVANELVLVDLDSGAQSVVVGDRDFVAAPRLGADGRLAWLAWNHPDMPWDGAAAWTGRLVAGALREVTRVAGGDGVAVADLDWLPDGRLVLTEDSTGFWEVAIHDPGSGQVRRVTERAADQGKPRGRFGRNALAVVGSWPVVVTTDHAVDGLAVVSEDGGRRELACPAVAVGGIVAHGPEAVVSLGLDVDGRATIRRHDLVDGSVELVDEIPPVAGGAVAAPVPVTVDVEGGVTHAFFHPPAHAEVSGPEGEAPPLLVFIHGGPTAHTVPVRTAAIGFWTSRGFAVVDVNYRGSSGYGRAYRQALRGRWGEAEVEDVMAVAADLARRGWVDGARMAIRGGSAGGFTTLAALTRPEHPFACGTSLFGVADLAALAEHTHKFESRYLDRLVGRLPEDRATYEERSPLTHVDRLGVPLLVLQGMDDEVVPPAQSQVIVDAAARLGVPHAYLRFEGEGHGFRKPENIVAWHEAELAFYGEVMGFTPAGDLPTVLT